jgi:muconolactone delta-isomerase
MKFLAIEREAPGLTADRFQPYLKAEAARAWELYQSGLIRELYFRADRPEAVFVLECTSLEQAQQVLGGLPLVREGLINFEIIPLGPYPGFKRLFRDTFENVSPNSGEPNGPA